MSSRHVGVCVHQSVHPMWWTSVFPAWYCTDQYRIVPLVWLPGDPLMGETVASPLLSQCTRLLPFLKSPCPRSSLHLPSQTHSRNIVFTHGKYNLRTWQALEIPFFLTCLSGLWRRAAVTSLALFSCFGRFMALVII